MRIPANYLTQYCIPWEPYKEIKEKFFRIITFSSYMNTCNRFIPLLNIFVSNYKEVDKDIEQKDKFANEQLKFQ